MKINNLINSKRICKEKVKLNVNKNENKKQLLIKRIGKNEHKNKGRKKEQININLVGPLGKQN